MSIAQHGKISLISALLININIIIGSGIFINILPLLAVGKSASFLAYLGAALLMLPVVISLAYLARAHPESGGLYIYGKKYLGSRIGFFTGWSYFLGKAVSVSLMVHLLTAFLQKNILFLAQFSHIFCDLVFFIFMITIYTIGVRLQGSVQWLFVCAKLFPVLFVGCIVFSKGVQVPFIFQDITRGTLFSLLPLGAFALVGTESSCAIAHLFDKPEKNIVRAMIGGFLIAALLITFFQIAVSFSLTHRGALFPLNYIANYFYPGLPVLQNLLTLAVYTSIFGGAFGIFIANGWNMERLIKNSSFGQEENQHNFLISLIAEAFIGLLALYISTSQVALQNMAVCGVVGAFLCAMFAAYKSGAVSQNIALLGIASSCVLASVTLYKIALYGISIPFLGIFISGLVLGHFGHFYQNS